jgi:leader peptidase (prepilin peptidase) / N-methyltransferase
MGWLTELTAGAGSAGPLLAPAFLAMLALSAWTDFRRRIVPDIAVAGGSVAAIAIAALLDPSSLDGRALWALGAGAFLLAAAVIRPGGLGLGDVKLGAAMALFLDASIVPALLSAFAIGSATAVPIIARHGLGARHKTIPFAPCLALGGILALVLGPGVTDWYLRTL